MAGPILLSTDVRREVIVCSPFLIGGTAGLYLIGCGTGKAYCKAGEEILVATQSRSSDLPDVSEVEAPARQRLMVERTCR